jgi:hypothetical protein
VAAPHRLTVPVVHPRSTVDHHGGPKPADNPGFLRDFTSGPTTDPAVDGRRCHGFRRGQVVQRGSPDARHAPGPCGWTTRWSRRGAFQSGVRRGGRGAGPPRAARTPTSAASSSGVGSPRTTRRNGGRWSAGSLVESFTAGCSRASCSATARAWSRGGAAP